MNAFDVEEVEVNLTRRPIPWLPVTIGIGLLAILLCMVLFLPVLLDPPLSEADLQNVTSMETRIQLQQTQLGLQNNTRTTLLQAAAGVLLAVGATATWRQAHTSREAQITERFTRAIDQIGSDNVDVRLGGIYALQRIARNSPDDRNTVQFILGAYLHTHASWAVGAPDGPKHPTPTVDKHLPWLQVRAPDINAAAGVLGRRLPSADPRRLYLSRVDLRRAELDGCRFAHARLRYVNLARAWLRGAVLDGSDLKGADLREAYLPGASLVGTNLMSAYLCGADLRGANLRAADLRGADLRAAHLDEAVLIDARSDPTTIWPLGFDAEQRRDRGVVETRDGYLGED